MYKFSWSSSGPRPYASISAFAHIQFSNEILHHHCPYGTVYQCRFLWWEHSTKRYKSLEYILPLS